MAAQAGVPGLAHDTWWPSRPCQPGAVQAQRVRSLSAAADSGSTTLAMWGQWHENQGRPGCTPDVDGRVDSHRRGSSTVGGWVEAASAVMFRWGWGGGGGDGSNELWGSLPAARGNREVRVRPQFEEGGAESRLIGRRRWRRCWLQN
jgi:hypothetical protein